MKTKQVTATARFNNISHERYSPAVSVKCDLVFRNGGAADAFLRLITTPEGSGSLFPRMQKPCVAEFKRLQKDEDLGDL